MVFKREIEKKFVVHNSTFNDVSRFLDIFLPEAEVEEGKSRDFFWQADGVDFVRLRENSEELTVKITDQDTIEDRVEENLKVPFKDGMRWATAVWGDPTGVLTKQFVVYYDVDFILSLYTVEGRKELFLEVESDDIEIVNRVSKDLLQVYDMTQEMRSLFTICFGDA